MKEILIGKFSFPFEKTLIMGILNVTPDSFFDGGRYIAEADAKARLEALKGDGADIIDIGGESTRPGFIKVSASEESARVIPMVKAACARGFAVSVDTTKIETAEQALECGADMLNDISGVTDKKMLELAAKYGASICIMHNSPLKGADIADEIGEDLFSRAKEAERAGILKSSIFLDTGIGFNKDYAQNLKILASLKSFGSLGYPTLLGVSRKSVIQKTLNCNAQGALYGTLALTALAVNAGVNVVRVHDVKENKDIIDMLAQINNINKTAER